eukprot:CAMPEP_0183346786 /NCGR_PEP_ID=MMETSP0164_2-20130417/11800_1 /TAXON_ID=221442 /ORGANISM="Coccolithus pelagicus ssp braarudi, Strain PLY182g" /LENGTH=37 /DNA_ID= /DNA_START= /DNA_END= /DNA_ORIENTATION=
MAARRLLSDGVRAVPRGDVQDVVHRTPGGRLCTGSAA